MDISTLKTPYHGNAPLTYETVHTFLAVCTMYIYIYYAPSIDNF